MIVKLLTEYHLEFLSLKGGCTGSAEYTRQNVTLLEISCTSSFRNIHLSDVSGPSSLIWGQFHQRVYDVFLWYVKNRLSSNY